MLFDSELSLGCAPTEPYLHTDLSLGCLSVLRLLLQLAFSNPFLKEVLHLFLLSDLLDTHVILVLGWSDSSFVLLGWPALSRRIPLRLVGILLMLPLAASALPGLAVGRCAVCRSHLLLGHESLVLEEKWKQLIDVLGKFLNVHAEVGQALRQCQPFRRGTELLLVSGWLVDVLVLLNPLKALLNLKQPPAEKSVLQVDLVHCCAWL